MRSLLLLSIVALPLAASAQARNITTLAPETTMAAALYGATGEGAGPLHVSMPLYQSIRTVVAPNFALDTPYGSSTLETIMGSPNEAAGPVLTKWAALAVPQQDLVGLKQTSQVAVKMVINPAGQPELLQIAKSVSPAIDAIALATVKDFRFKPAEVDHVPVDVPVTVTITFNE